VNQYDRPSLAGRISFYGRLQFETVVITRRGGAASFHERGSARTSTLFLSYLRHVDGHIPASVAGKCAANE